MSKTVTIQIQGRSYTIHTTEDAVYLSKIAAQLDLLISDAARSCAGTSLIEQLILVGLEQQDQICCLKKQITTLEDKLEHYDLGEGLGCVADYRDSLALVNNRADSLQRENDSLRAQLKDTFAALTKLTESNAASAGKDADD